MRRPAAALVLLVLLTAPEACKRKPPQIPPPPLQTPAPEPAPRPEPQPGGVAITPGKPVVAPAVDTAPPPVKPAPPKPSAPKPASRPAVVEPEPVPAPPTPPVPSLAPLLSPQEQTRYRTEIDASLARARRRLGTLAQRQLTEEQKTSLNRVRTFISQAEAVRSRDIATAAGLARRADILSAELVANTQ